MKKIFRKVASKYVNSLAKSLSGRSGNKHHSYEADLKRNPRFEKEGSLIVGRLPGYFLIFSIVGVLYLLYTIIGPFFPTLLLAGVFTILFHGMFKSIERKFGKYRRAASGVTCLIIFLIILVPISLLITLLSNEAIGMYQTISSKIASGYFDSFLVWDKGNWLFNFNEKLKPVIDLGQINLKETILNAAQTVSTFLVSQAAVFAANIGSILLNAIIMFFSMFYLFLDGETFVRKFTILSPLPKKYETQIYGRIKDTIRAIASGVFLTAIIQGVCAGIGYTIAGISNPVFWAAATGVFSLIPLLGTGTIWVPASLILLATGNYASGIFLLIWGTFLVATIDNFVEPYLIGGRAKMNPLLTFFVVIGGVFTFGAQGLIFGPIVLVLFLTLLHVYELEYKQVLDK